MSAPESIAGAPPSPVEPVTTRFLTGAGLPVFLASALLAYEAFLLVTVLGPTDGTWLGGFIRDFQLWCYRGDPRTGGVSWAAVSVMFLEPLFVVAVAAVLWRQALAGLASHQAWRRQLGAAGGGVILVALVVAGLVAWNRSARARQEAVPPFPGESIRVHLPLPDAPLVDQKGAPLRFADLRGSVVLVTGVYAACTTACPEIFKELQAQLAALSPSERAGLKVVALSLNPEYETTELMDAIAQGRGFNYPEFRYVNGRKAAEMHDMLTQLQFSAVRDPRTGVVNHANLFLVIDRKGEIAYRFTLEPRHRAWLHEALRALVRETHAAPVTP